MTGDIDEVILERQRLVHPDWAQLEAEAAARLQGVDRYRRRAGRLAGPGGLD